MAADLGWKATSAITTLVSGIVAEKAVKIGWKLVTGHEAPEQEDQLLTYQLAEVIAFAVISGAAMTVTRQLTLRQAAKWYGGHEIENPLEEKKLKVQG